jgi:hypothetical protein
MEIEMQFGFRTQAMHFFQNILAQRGFGPKDWPKSENIIACVDKNKKEVLQGIVQGGVVHERKCF